MEKPQTWFAYCDMKNTSTTVKLQMCFFVAYSHFLCQSFYNIILILSIDFIKFIDIFLTVLWLVMNSTKIAYSINNIKHKKKPIIKSFPQNE